MKKLVRSISLAVSIIFIASASIFSQTTASTNSNILLDCTGKIGSKIWLDYSSLGAATNCNGIQDANEPGIQGVTVKLKDNLGAVIDTKVTDANGEYSFTIADLCSSDVDCKPCEGKVTQLTMRYDGTLQNATIKVVQKKPKIAVFKEIVQPGGEFTFSGVDNKGTLSTEIEIFVNGVSNTKIHTSCSVDIGPGLVSGDFTVIKGYSKEGGLLCEVTGGTGVLDKCFSVEVDESTLPAGLTPTLTTVGSLRDKDSNPNPSLLCLNSVENENLTIDFGYCQNEQPCKSTIGNLIWRDSNLDGVQTNGELGIAGVVVDLLNESGSKITSATTNNNGIYQFAEVVNGNYKVKVSDVNFASGGIFEPFDNSKWYATKQNRGGDDNTDSDGDTKFYTAAVTVHCADNPTIDFGFYKTCLTIEKTGPASVNVGEKIKYHFRVENCGDVILHGGVSVYDKLLKPSGDNKIWSSVVDKGQVFEFDKEFTTNDAHCGSLKNTVQAVGHPQLPDGSFLTNVTAKDTMFVNVICEEPVSIGNKVWYDQNENGIQDGGENGVEGITVNLFDCENQFLKTVVTNSDGGYLFDNLSGGNFYVQFVKPNGYDFTAKNLGGNSELDSDADLVTGKTLCTTLDPGEDDLSWDAGIYYSKAAIGDHVWLDKNKNGIQDVGESGIANITVNLFDCSDLLKSSAVTDNDGAYIFQNLNGGGYYLQFVKPVGYDFTSKDAGDDAKDSDADLTSGKTECTTLDNGEYDMTWDAGMHLIPPTPEADLRILKSLSDDTPDDGDVVTYTITVFNDGPDNAVNVEITDLLPTGVIYQSSSTTFGTYNPSSGIWNVGNLNFGASAVMTISAKVDIGYQSTSSWDLGPAKDYNVFILYDINQPSSDTEGKMAVGRNAYFARYSHGYRLPNSQGTEDVLIVNKNLTYKSGRVFNGNVVYGGLTNLPVDSVGIVEGTLRQDTPIDFDAARSYLTTLSGQLSNYSANGTIIELFSYGLDLIGTDPYLNVFDLDGAVLSTKTEMNIKVPNGSVVLINVSGTGITFTGGLTVVGTSIGNVLYNFYEAQDLYIHHIDIRGSILAPFAVVNFESGIQNGQMIAAHLYGMGQFNKTKFIGNIPTDACVINIAEVSKSNLIDPDSTPGDGEVDDDDYASALFCVTYEGNTAGGGGDGGGEWEYAGEFGVTEIVWSLANDPEGNLYAGTWGGKIYMTTDQIKWTVINEGMEAAYIWSLDEYNGFIFAGTERGVYRYDGETWLLNETMKQDVRSIRIDEYGKIYAATWGNGVFKSNDYGLTWTQQNEGMEGSLALHSLVFNSLGDLFAGSMGGGVSASQNGGMNWKTIDIGYEFIWSLGATSNNVIFAGTYGKGLYISDDNGSTWYNSDLPAAYVYSITIDALDNIYVSTWESGVYVSKDYGATWISLGMGGLGVSSIMITPVVDGLRSSKESPDQVKDISYIMYAGTSDGKIYKKLVNKTTDITEDGTIPTEFALENNYPNPFNPSTIIEFSIPLSGNYKLEVFNILGEKITTLVRGHINPGKHSVTFNALNYASGVYIYRLHGSGVNISRKMLLLK
ncbi:MAG: SdrD B-like domain-containing protein [Bacteroidota bacterium]